MKIPADMLHDILTGDDQGRICRDIPEEACRHQPRNFTLHVASLAATKTGDGFADPKLVLAWLLGAMGAPAVAIGLLVPLREAGALLPQLAFAGAIRRIAVRKWAWAAGSLVQGLAVLGMAASAVWLSGPAGGWTIVALVGVFALARSVCSVSHKDVLGKTVSKNSRGTVSGSAATFSAVAVFAFGLAVSLRIIPLTVGAIGGVLAVAGALWLTAAVLYSRLHEEPGATEGGGNALDVARSQFSLLGEDSQLVRFIVTRALLVATALAPPYLLALAGQQNGGRLGALGPFVIASALAAVLSTYVWGRFSDRSSRQVLAAAALIGANAVAAAAAVGVFMPGPAGSGLLLPAILFVLMIAYQGVRLGRSTHIVDMTDETRRASYTALSNTIIGVVLLAGGLFGVLAEFFGNVAVLLVFAAMCLAAAVSALGLQEVQ